VAPLQKFVKAMSSFTSKNKKEAVILEVGPSGSVKNGSQMLRGYRTFNVNFQVLTSQFEA
jgi:hypothetical protein